MSLERFRPLTADDLAALAQRCCGPAPAELALAVRQFNQGEYFVCHETLEALWRAEPGPLRRLYQGILHLAVGLYHLQRGNRHGALTKLRSGLAYLEPVPAHCLGLELDALRHQVRHCVESIEALPPQQLGRFDWHVVPRLRTTAGR
ncbi:MAG: DUF309 domain-containing protein [Chloroflexi bacterium]|nr:DUF309 domain-containing protein [Chloroflexota bacterium]GIW12488.1 MAG: hypothetical protein KatS3mg061_3545 [Dehalococcoidia bacterium]